MRRKKGIYRFKFWHSWEPTDYILNIGIPLICIVFLFGLKFPMKISSRSEPVAKTPTVQDDRYAYDYAKVELTEPEPVEEVEVKPEMNFAYYNIAFDDETEYFCIEYNIESDKNTITMKDIFWKKGGECEDNGEPISKLTRRDGDIFSISEMKAESRESFLKSKEEEICPCFINTLKGD